MAILFTCDTRKSRAAQRTSWRAYAAALAIATVTVPALAQDSDVAKPEAERALRLENDAKEIANEKARIDLAESKRALGAAKRKDITDSFPTSPTDGGVTIGDNAGKMEAEALAASAINWLADDIANDVDAATRKPGLPAQASERGDSCATDLLALKSVARTDATGSVPIIIAAGDAPLAFEKYATFRFRACQAAAQFRAAIKDAGGGRSAGEGGGAGFLPGVGTALTAVSKLAQLIAPNYEIEGITLEKSNGALHAAIARELTANGASDGVYSMAAVSRLDGAAHVFAALSELERLDGVAAKRLAQPKKAPALNKIKIGALTGARDGWKKLFADLNGAPAQTSLPIGEVAKEAAIERLLGRNGLVLNATIQSANGGLYARKSLFNAFNPGSPAAWVSGGVVIHFMAVRAGDQRIMAAGLFTCSAGYVRLRKVAQIVNGDGRRDQRAGCKPLALPYQPVE